MTHFATGKPEIGSPALGHSGPVATPTEPEIIAAYNAFVHRTGTLPVPQPKLLDAMLEALIAAARVRAGLK